MTDETQPAAPPTEVAPVEVAPVVEPTEDYGPYFDGMWMGTIPNFKCPNCEFKTVDGPAAIEAHMVEHEPSFGLGNPNILGPDGRPLGR